MAIYSVVFETTGTSPFVSGARGPSFQRFKNVISSLLGGARPTGTHTVTARNLGVRATGTVTVAAVQSGDTVTLNGTALTATQHYATGTITCASVADADTATVAGVVLTAKTSASAATEWTRGGTDTADALALVACINANCTTVTATSALGVVTIRAVASGTGGNAITLATSNNTRLAKSGTTLANGAAIANNQFDFTGTDTQNAAALVTAIGASTTSLVADHTTPTNVLGVVTFTAKQPGVSGNAITLASSNNTRLLVSGSRLTGGTETLLTAYSF